MEGTSGRSRRTRTGTAKSDNSSCSLAWSTKERHDLLIAMKKYGTLDLPNLHKAVPTKSRERIRQYIIDQAKNCRHAMMKRVVNKYKGLQRQGLLPPNSKCYGPLDVWLSKMKDVMPPNFNEARAVSVAKVVQLIAWYEDQPDPSVCGGVDFKALYEFLFYVLSGLPPKNLDPTTAAFLLSSMGDFVRDLKKKDLEEHRKFLEQYLEPSFTNGNPDFRSAKVSDSTPPSRSMAQLMNIPGFNPFNIPASLLVKKD